MRRQIFISLVLLGVVVLAVLQLTGGLTGPRPQNNGSQIRLTEFTPPNPAVVPGVGSLQTSLDFICREALEERWAVAAQEALRLENMWRSMQVKGPVLEIEESISRGIENLHLQILRRDIQGVLDTAEDLTAHFSQLRT